MVINDRVEDAVMKIESIVTAEKCRVERNMSFYSELKGGIDNDLSIFR